MGAEIYARGAKRMIRVQCEMGGKNPVVVLADADLDLAVESTAQGAFGSTGQRCTATSRVIVEEAIADEFVEALAARAGKVRVGNGLESGVDMGPAVDDSQLETDLKYIEIGREEGDARLRRPPAQGRRPRPRLLRGADRVRPRQGRRCASPRRRSSGPSSPSSA